MEYNLRIGGVGFHILSDYELHCEDAFANFCDAHAAADVNIVFTRDFFLAPRPEGAMLGKDLILEYYRSDHGLICFAREGEKGFLSVAECSDDFSRITCYMNCEDFFPRNSLANHLRMLPMRRILQYFGTSFFHASQISVDNTGILFTAPSGTGKTTQARLWRDHRGAQIVCNDRTLIRNGMTYGFPIDGSEPVRSGQVNQLGAIVLLKQDSENSVRRLRPGNAIAALLPQLVIDIWDPQARTLAIEQLMDLLRAYPVYLLSCRPDADAVDCLAQRLAADGVII